MPCHSEYMNATGKEVALSQVACLLDELNGKPKIDKSHWIGYHPKIYGKQIDGDALIAELRDRLITEDVTKYSLEMQMWWRDYQREKKYQLERELQKQRTEKEKAAALAKLSKHERKLLGL